MRALVLDLRAAARALFRRPLFSLAVVATLGLGLGASISLWTLVDGVLLRPLPLRDPGQLLFITRSGDVSILDGQDWRAGVPSLQGTALFLRRWAFDLGAGSGGDGHPVRLSGSVAEPELFRVLGVEPLVGRALQAADDVRGGPRVAVLSEKLWRQRFAADPAVVGRTLLLSDNPTEIVGVMPAAADFLGDGVDLWVPPAIETPWAIAERGTNNFDAIGRLREGATLEQAVAELRTVCERLAAEFPTTNTGKIVVPMPLLDFLVGGVRRPLWLLLGAVLMVLAIACLNTGALLLVRTLGRARELGVRAALGAGKSQLLTPLLAETLLLCGAGLAVGLGLAFGGRQALLAAAPAALPRPEFVTFDVRAVAFALLATLAAALAATLLPARGSLKLDPQRALAGGKGQSAGRGHERTLSAVVAAQVALATLLLCGAVLLGASLRQLWREELGFRSDGLWSASVVLPESRYGQREAQNRAFAGLVEAIDGLPQVEGAAYITNGPLEPNGGIGHTVVVEGRPADPERRGARSRPVLGDYFAVAGLQMLQGRPLANDDDRPGAERVAVVNQRFAERFFPGEQPVGRRFSWAYDGKADTWMTIVGVVADVKARQVAGNDEAAAYHPYVQRTPGWVRFGTLVFRVKDDPAAAGGLGQALRQAFAAVDPGLPLGDVLPFDELRARSLAQQRFQSLLLGAFALYAFVLALQGLFAMLAFRLEAMRFELGLRAAIGATGRDLGLLVTRRGLAPILIGLGVGIAGTLAAGPLVESLLFGIAARDPRVPLAVALFLLAAALLACWPLARRAARTEPMTALREL